MLVFADGPLNLPELEEQVLQRWDEQDTVARARTRNAGGRAWMTVEGPPTVNGNPALHHVFTSAYKDIYARFQSLRGRSVTRRGGWDCQGLPVEIAVERKLGLKDKPDIERYGIDKFVAECRELVTGNIGNFEAVLQRAGYWVDYERAYRTMDDDYLESVWSHLKVMWDRGLVYEGHRVVPYCIRCGTALSSHELGQPNVYQDRTDTTAYVGFRLDDRPWELVVWTTTPWTLPANVAVAVHPERDYGVYDVDGRQLVIAVALAAPLVGDLEPSTVLRGADLVASTYRRPFPEVGADNAPYGRVVAWDDVAEDLGTGLVHIAPAFGMDDYNLGRANDLPVVNPISGDGRYVEGPWAGVKVFDAVEPIMAELAARSLLVRPDTILHSYPHCWRCQTPLIYWAKPTWFIATSTIKQDLIDQNEQINWFPDSIKHGRFGNWLRDNIDWAVSRDRYWGTPLPIWRCEQGHDTCVGSRAELGKLADRDLADLSLHRPTVDDVQIACPDCGEPARRTPSVCDVWLDSGCAPAAQWHASAEAGRGALGDRFPADFICEAIDQTRGWFYSLLAANTMVFDTTPYRNVVCLGHLVDDEGRKMSKSLGNVIDPLELFPRYGADGLRWYLFNLGAPWGPKRISREAMGQRLRRDLDTLWNTTSFYRQYARIEDFSPSGEAPRATNVMDRWILSRLDRLIVDVTAGLEGYEAHAAAAQLSDFVDELSNWYVRRSRRRFWNTDSAADGSDTSALATLHHVLRTLALLLAPFTPFFAEALWVAVQGEDVESVHLADWPAPAEVADVVLDDAMADARRIASLVRSARTEAALPVRQPLKRVIVSGDATLTDEVRAVVAEEINTREIVLGGAQDIPTRREVRPNWRTLGPRYKQLMKQISLALENLPEGEGDRLAAGEALTLFVDDRDVLINPDDVSITEHVEQGWVTARDGSLTVALDTSSDEDLQAEFRRRTLVRHIQVARREGGLDIQDRIRLGLPDDVWADRAAIADEVLAVETVPLGEFGDPPGAVTGSDFAFVRVAR